MLTAAHYLQHEEGYHNYVIAKAEYLQSHNKGQHSRLLKKSKAKCAPHHRLIVKMVKRECTLPVIQRAMANAGVDEVDVDETNISRYIKNHITNKVDPADMLDPNDIVSERHMASSLFPNMYK